VKHETLSLIPPQFECPLPPLQPATFPPAMREPPPPALDQFDLDEHFASEKQRLAQLANKCTDNDDLDYFIRESGEILGVTAQLQARAGGGPPAAPSAKDVLHFIFKNVVNFKRVNPLAEEAAHDGGNGNGNGGNGGGGGDYYGNGNGGGEGKHDGGSDRQVFSFDDSDRQLRPAHLPSMMGRPAGESGANTEWGHK